MLDIRWIRDNPDVLDAELNRRGAKPEAHRLLDLDGERREAVTLSQQIQTGRNELSREIGNRKRQGKDATDLIEKVSRSKEQQAEAEEKARDARSRTGGRAGRDSQSAGGRCS